MEQFTRGIQMRSSATPTANGQFHLYLADAEGRKIAALWGSNDEKMANGYLWSAAPLMLAALERVRGAYGFDPSIDSSIWQEVGEAIDAARPAPQAVAA